MQRYDLSHLLNLLLLSPSPSKIPAEQGGPGGSLDCVVSEWFLPSLKEVHTGLTTNAHFCFEQCGSGGQSWFLEILIMESVSPKKLANVKRSKPPSKKKCTFLKRYSCKAAWHLRQCVYKRKCLNRQVTKMFTVDFLLWWDFRFFLWGFQKCFTWR